MFCEVTRDGLLSPTSKIEPVELDKLRTSNKVLVGEKRVAPELSADLAASGADVVGDELGYTDDELYDAWLRASQG